jgi:hypothetical protein
MKRTRAKPANLDPKHPYDQRIVEVCPGYYNTFLKMGLEDVARVLLLLPDMPHDMPADQRQRVAKALYAFADELNDKDEEYYLNRLADRVLGYSADEEG